MGKKQKNRMNIQSYIYLTAFVSALVVTGLAGGVVFTLRRSAENLAKQVSLIVDTQESNKELQIIFRRVTESFNVLATGNASNPFEILEALNEQKTSFESVLDTKLSRSGQTDKIADLRRGFNKFTETGAKMSLASIKKSQDAVDLIKLYREQEKETEAILKSLDAALIHMAHSSKDRLSGQLRNLIWVVSLIAGSAILILIVTIWLTLRNINSLLKGALENASTRVVDLLSVKELVVMETDLIRNGVESQVDSLTEISTAMQEISTTVQANAKHAQETMRFARQTKTLCDASREKLNAASVSVEAIDSSTRELTIQFENNNSELNRIKDLIEDINQKVNIINEIAFQTKLLSFNASVEAARAGEAGKGFAVVAQEVGNLARMSADSASTIDRLLLESMTEVSNLLENSKARLSSSIEATSQQIHQSLSVTRESREKLTELQEAVDHVEAIANQVAEAAVQQERGVADVNEAILRVKVEIDKVNTSTSKTDETMKELAEATDGLSESMKILRKVSGSKHIEEKIGATEQHESPQWTQDRAS